MYQILKNFLTASPIVLALTGQSQNLDILHKDAMGKFYDEDLINAREIFKEIIAIDSNYKDSQYRLQICELLTDQRNRSIDRILKYRATYGESDKFYNYWLGRIYVDKYKFQNAISVWKRFLESKDSKSEEIRDQVNVFIKKANELIAMFDNPSDFQIHQLEEPVNSEYDEITPVFFQEKDELIFASSRDPENPQSATYFIYYSKREEDDWSSPIVMRNLGRFEFEKDANLQLVNEDGKLFQFRPERGGGLYYSEATDDGWSIPQEFDNRITKAHIRPHFFINERENRIIFTLDQHYKKEGMELYQSYKDPKNENWIKPTLLSPTISSSWDEDTPYLSPDEKSIYFSSNRPDGLGGFDIYVSRLNEETNSWSEPENMGFPINTPDDELHFKMNFDQKSGYFSSSRYSSKGKYDIYFFWQNEEVNITGRIVDLSTGLPAKNISISFRPSQYLDEYFRSDVDDNGNYRTKIISEETFKVEIVRNGQIIYTDEYEVHGTGGVATMYHQDFFIGESTEVIIRNVYFDHGSRELKESSTVALQGLLQTMIKSSNLRIEVAGHTDNTGASDANQWLSERRAEAIQNWLVKNGIAASRITPKGYGESKPMVSNDDEKDGRELNRRIEISVIK